MRVYDVYLYVTAFVAVVVLVAAGVSGVYGLFRMAAPSVTRTGFQSIALERAQGTVQAVPSLLLAGAAAAVFGFHWRRTSRHSSKGPAQQDSTPSPAE